MSRIGGENMADEPDNVVPVVLCDDNKIVRYSPGQSSGTQLRQAPQESKIDELFQKLEKLLSDKMPV
jgi:hypothetical protein